MEKMNNKELLLSGYTITKSENFINMLYPMPNIVRNQLDELYHLSKNGKKSCLKRLLDLIEKYPQIPILKNYLTTYYAIIGNEKKSEEVNHWIVAEHPDYLFGKLNLAAEYWKNHQYDKMADVLGETMDLKALYPQRDTFHFSEVTGFFKFSILYFVSIGEIEQAEIRLDILYDLAPESDDYNLAAFQLIAAQVKFRLERILKLKESEISVKTNITVSGNSTQMPQFTHPEIELLYNQGLYIEKEKLEKIISLPRKTLINDLELVLNDSIDRYDYFRELYDEDCDEEKMEFLIHAFFLLGEIEATESLESILNIFRQDEDYYELYFGDLFTNDVWDSLYKIANNQLEVCKQFMYEPAIYTYSKSTIIQMVEQIALHHPERRYEISAWFNDVLSFYLNCKTEDNIIDSNLIGLMVCCLFDLKLEDSLPLIQKLYEKGYVSINICGTYDDVVQEFEEPLKYNHKNDLLSISEIYKKITSKWANYEEAKKEIHSAETHEDLSKIINKKSNVGRNDPCTCGSGKKYKKCCWNN